MQYILVRAINLWAPAVKLLVAQALDERAPCHSRKILRTSLSATTPQIGLGCGLVTRATCRSRLFTWKAYKVRSYLLAFSMLQLYHHS